MIWSMKNSLWRPWRMAWWGAWLLSPLLCSGAAQAVAPVANPVSANPSWPPALAQAWQATGLPLSSLSLWVQGVDARQPALSWSGEQPRRMASVMKLFTTGVALRALGPAYTWTTPVALNGVLDAQGVLHGSLHIKASGDPSLDTMRLREALQTWRDAGLREIHGDVLVDRSLWALPPYDPAAFDGAPWKAYNAGPDPWLLAHGAVTLRWQANGGREDRPLVAMYPALVGVNLDNQVRLLRKGFCGDWREGMSLQITEGRDGQRTLVIQGQYPVSCGTQNWPLRWPARDSLDHSARVFLSTWAQLGGQVTGVVREGPWPAQASPWLSWTSSSLTEVVRDINKFSNNVMARQLFLTLGGLSNQAVPADQVLPQARAWVAQQVRQATQATDGSTPCAPPEALVLDNGAGLSRTEGSTAHCMARWLQVMWADPRMPEWLASLPVAGMDGTARRMGSAVGMAHLKTGSLDEVVSLAGIVQSTGGQRYTVVAVVNHPKAEQARPALQALLQWINQGADSAPATP